MKQAGTPPEGKWTGPSHAGVKSPQPIVIADPARRFAATAQRLEQLVDQHPLEAWLRFMAALAHAQHTVATMLAPAAKLDASAVKQTVDARLPPLAADGHRRDPSWSDGLALLLELVDDGGLPIAAQDAMEQLRTSDAAALERLADQFLRGGLSSADAAPAVYVAAALQVYFT